MGLIKDDVYVKDVCKIGQGHKCCRYLTMDAKGWECMKLSTELVHSLADMMAGTKPTMTAKDLLDGRVERKEMVARGDNCEGR